jgi:co-chaperonin GroES (HSP10)
MKSKNKQVIVVGDRVLIRPDEGEKKSAAGLYLPASVLEKQDVRGGIVV